MRIETKSDEVISEILFEKVIFGAWLLKEKHHKELCNCSYCEKLRSETKNVNLWLPVSKAFNSWRILAVKKVDAFYYYRTTLPRLQALFGIELTKWGVKGNRYWRLRLGGFGMGKDSGRSLLTLTSHQFFETKIPHVEYLLWKDLEQPSLCDCDTVNQHRK